MAPNTKSQNQQKQSKNKDNSPAPSETQQPAAKDSNNLNATEEAELCQWLEFAADVANRKNLTDDQAMVYLQFLNKALTQRAFVTGPRSSTADTTLYAALRDTLGKLSFYDKDKIPQVGRWFSHLQSLKGQKTSGVIFSLTPLY